MKSKSKQDEGLSFEAAFARLEEVLAKLEAGNLPLEEAVALYEEGMRLARLCQERLEGAELRIRELQSLPRQAQDNALAETRREPPPARTAQPSQLDLERELFGER